MIEEEESKTASSDDAAAVKSPQGVQAQNWLNLIHISIDYNLRIVLLPFLIQNIMNKG